MWGIIPAAGMGTRLQPLGFSKELLPVGSQLVGDVERPRAVSEFLVERMQAAGATRICFVVAPGKSDIVQYYGSRRGSADLCYVVQPQAGGLCDAIFRACTLVRPDEPVLVGLPDTIWFPEDGYAQLPADTLAFLLFPVDRPQAFDAVVTDEDGVVQEIQVKHPDARTNWIWGAFRMPGHVLHALEALWLERGKQDEYIGTLVNAWIQRGGRALGVRAGQSYVDTGTVHGYREALALLGQRRRAVPPAPRGPDTVCGPAGQPLVRRAPPAAHPLPGKLHTRAEIEARVQALGDWFHNIDLLGVPTAPAHFLGDFPAAKFRRVQHVLPADLHGMTVLDIGCNAGWYSLEMKRRGADRVVGIDHDEYWLAQARYAAEVLGLDVEYRRLPVYDVAALGERFDLVLFMGTVYHLRHPLLALDLIHAHVARDLLLYQSLQRGSAEMEPVATDYPFWETEVFERPGYPRLHFVEHSYSHDQTNWWIPNAACSAAMLRSAGFDLVAHPEEEVFLCKRGEVPPGAEGLRAVHPARPPTGAPAA